MVFTKGQGRENHHYNDAKGVQEKKKENAGKSSVTCNQAEPQETAWAWQGKCVYKKNSKQLIKYWLSPPTLGKI